MGAIWQQSKSTDKRGSNDFEGGINQGLPSLEMADDQTTEEYGWDTEEHPALQTAKGKTVYGASGGAQTNLLTNYGNTHLVRAVGTTLQYDNAGTWTNITGTFTNTDWDTTNFNNKLILTNGTDNVKQWNGSALSDLSASAPKGKYITSDTLRVWIAEGDVLHFSAFQTETDWTTAENSGSVQYYTPNGGDITGLHTFQNNILVFKKNAMAVRYGDNYFNYKLVEVSNDIGCVSFKTIQEVGERVFWLGQNDVYGFSGGKPYPIGFPIRDYLDDINPTYLNKCFGGTDGIRYYLGLVTGANTEPNILLVYDPRVEIWRVNRLNDNFRYSATFNNTWYVGDSTGQTYKLKESTDDDGTAISWSVTSKPFDEKEPEAEKEYYEMHIQAYVPTGSTLTVYVNTSDRGGTWTEIDSITSSSEAQSMDVIIPLDTVPLTKFFRYRLSGSGPVTIYKVQRYFRIQPVQH